MKSKIIDREKIPVPPQDAGPPMGLMGGTMFSKLNTGINSNESSVSLKKLEAERLQSPNASPFMNNNALSVPLGDQEKRILHESGVGQLPDAVLGALSWKTNPKNDSRFYELILKEPLFEVLQAGMTKE